jgi:hypothetical protein
MTKRTLATILLLLGAIPLVIYPGIIFANVMALAASGGHLRPPASLVECLFTYVIVGATTYPIVWLVALVRSIILIRRGREVAALGTSLVPLVFLATLPLAFLVGQAAAA